MPAHENQKHDYFGNCDRPTAIDDPEELVKNTIWYSFFPTDNIIIGDMTTTFVFLHCYRSLLSRFLSPVKWFTNTKPRVQSENPGLCNDGTCIIGPQRSALIAYQTPPSSIDNYTHRSVSLLVIYVSGRPSNNSTLQCLEKGRRLLLEG